VEKVFSLQAFCGSKRERKSPGGRPKEKFFLVSPERRLDSPINTIQK
jgi:hypothetical protein